MITSGEKWELWLKSVITTLIFILLSFEVFIVSNEARKIMKEDAISVCCVNGALKVDYGDRKFQLGPSVVDLQNGVKFVARNVFAVVPPFNLILLASKLVDYFS